MTLSERRLVENELFFRKPNEKVAKGLVELKEMAQQDNQSGWYPEVDDPVEFYCECSNLNCKKRIKLRPSVYLKLHQNSNQFIILPGHNIPDIERTMKSEEKYIIVEKYISPSQATRKGK